MASAGIPGEYPLDDQTLYWVGRSLGGYLRRASAAAARADRHGHARVRAAHRRGDRRGAGRGRRRNSSAGIISTPGVACLVRKEKFAAGVVISASHNPYHDNGVKLFAGSGMKFPDEIEEQLEAEILRHRNGRPPRDGAASSRRTARWTKIIWSFCGAACLPGANLSRLEARARLRQRRGQFAGPGAVPLAGSQM